MQAKIRGFLELFVWVMVLVYVADNEARYAILESKETFVMLSVIAGVRVGFFIKSLGVPSGSPQHKDWLIAVSLPFISVLSILLLALVARLIWSEVTLPY